MKRTFLRRDLHADGVIYQDEDFLQLSGLQHFKFCRRQWALIHVEKQWAENYRTTDGAIMHENAHDGSFTESRGDLVITRVAITTEADAEKKNTEMGRKYIVPYGLYRAEGYVSANLARKTTGFSEEDPNSCGRLF